MNKLALALGVATLAATSTPALATSLEKGITAFEAGNYETAASLLIPSQKTSTKAQCILAKMYQHGLGVKEDETTAENLYTAAARAGDAEAQFQLALIYLDISVTTADDWLKMAEEAGHSEARFVRQQIMKGEFDDAC